MFKCKCFNLFLILVRQLAAGRVDVFTPASPQAGIDFMLLQVVHEAVDDVFFRFFEGGEVDGIVFDDVHKVREWR